MNLRQKLLRRISHFRRERSVKHAHRKHRLRHAADYLELDSFVNKFRASGGLKHDYQTYKLWCLKQLLADYSPKRILELGSGSSTLVFADYVRKNDCTLLSIDEDEKWASNTSRLVGIKDSDNIQIKAAKKVFESDRIPPESKYDIKLEGEFDFVLIDGPSLRSNDGVRNKHAVNTNVFELPRLPKVILVDVRKATSERLSQEYNDKYDVCLSELFSGRPIKPDYNYFSVFAKKELVGIESPHTAADAAA